MAFFKSVRENLDPRFKLDVTIESPDIEQLPNETSWTQEDARLVLETVDGVDVMVYDTGFLSKEAYTNHVYRTSKILSSLAASYKTKQIRLGLPAYDDRTTLHNPDIENIGSATDGLKRLIAENSSVFCLQNFQISIFEASGMTTQDITYLKKLQGMTPCQPSAK